MNIQENSESLPIIFPILEIDNIFAVNFITKCSIA